MHGVTALGWLLVGLSRVSAAASMTSTKDHSGMRRPVHQFCRNVSDGDALEMPWTLTEEEQEMVEVICTASNATCSERVHCSTQQDEHGNATNASTRDVCAALNRVAKWVEMLTKEDEFGAAQPLAPCVTLNLVVVEWPEVAGNGSRRQDEEDEEEEARVGSKWCTDEQAVDEEDGKGSGMSSFPATEGSDTQSARGAHTLYPDSELFDVCQTLVRTSTTSHETAHEHVEFEEDLRWAIIVAAMFICVLIVACVVSRCSRHTKMRMGSRDDKLGYGNNNIFLSI